MGYTTVVRFVTVQFQFDQIAEAGRIMEGVAPTLRVHHDTVGVARGIAGERDAGLSGGDEATRRDLLSTTTARSPQ